MSLVRRAEQEFEAEPSASILQKMASFGRAISIPLTFLAASAQDAFAGPTLREIQESKFSRGVSYGKAREFTDSGNRYLSVEVENAAVEPKASDPPLKQYRDLARRRTYLVFDHKGTLDPEKLELVEDMPIYRRVVFASRVLKELEQGLGENIALGLQEAEGLENIETAEAVLYLAKKVETFATSWLIGTVSAGAATRAVKDTAAKSTGAATRAAEDTAARFFFREMQKAFYGFFKSGITTNDSFKEAMYREFRDSMSRLGGVGNLAKEFPEGGRTLSYRVGVAEKISDALVKGLPPFRATPLAMRGFYFDNWGTNLLLDTWAAPIAEGAVPGYISFRLDSIVDGFSGPLKEFKEALDEEGDACLFRYGYEGAAESTDSVVSRLRSAGFLQKAKLLKPADFGLAQQSRSYSFSMPIADALGKKTGEAEGQITMHISGPRAVLAGDTAIYRVYIESRGYPLTYSSAIVGSERTAVLPKPDEIKSLIGGVETGITKEAHADKWKEVERQLKDFSLLLPLVDSSFSGSFLEATKHTKQITDWLITQYGKEIVEALPWWGDSQRVQTSGLALFREPRTPNYNSVVFQVPVKPRESGTLYLGTVSDAFVGDSSNASVSAEFDLSVGELDLTEPVNAVAFYYLSLAMRSEPIYRALFSARPPEFPQMRPVSWEASAPEISGDSARVIVSSGSKDGEKKEEWAFKRKEGSWLIDSISEYREPLEEQPKPAEATETPVLLTSSKIPKLNVQSVRVVSEKPLPMSQGQINSVSFSPDSKYAAIGFDPDSEPGISSETKMAICDLESGTILEEIPDSYPGNWNGQRLVYCVIKPGSGRQRLDDVYLWDPHNGKGPLAVTNRVEVKPLWLGDGRLIYFGGEAHLRLMRELSLVVTNLKDFPGTPHEPINLESRAPYGQSKIIGAAKSGDFNDIFTYDVDSTKSENLTNTLDIDEDEISVGPDGTIAYKADPKDGRSDIYILHQGKPLNLTRTPDWPEFTPSWLGNLILYEAIGEPTTTSVVDPRTGLKKALIDRRAGEFLGSGAKGSPNGRYIVFGRRYSIRVATVSGF